MHLVIHAGIHRTGTSSLQDFLAGNREALAARGILYPGDLKNHQQVAWAIKRGESGARHVLQLLQTGGAPAQTAVLSAEDFCIHEDLGWLSKLASEIKIDVHFYLRRQDHWLMSWYNQHIKWPFDRWKSRMSPDEFLMCLDDFYWIDFEKLVSRWEGVLGTDAVHVSVVEPGQVEDVTGHFIGQLGLSAGDLPNPSKRANNSMPIHLLEVARHLGLHELPPPLRVKTLGALRKALPAAGDLPKTVYAPSQRRSILDRFSASNQALAKRRFQRDRLFLEAAPDDSDPYYRFPDLSRDDYLRDWIKPLLHELLKR